MGSRVCSDFGVTNRAPATSRASHKYAWIRPLHARRLPGDHATVMRLVSLLTLLACTACGGHKNHVSYRLVTAPNGIPGAWITCKRDQGACYEKAGLLCPHGYAVLRDDGTIVGQTSQGAAWGGPNVAAARVETESKYEGHLFVQCWAARPTAPGAPAPQGRP